MLKRLFDLFVVILILFDLFIYYYGLFVFIKFVEEILYEVVVFSCIED